MTTKDSRADTNAPLPPKKKRGFLDILLSDEPETVLPVASKNPPVSVGVPNGSVPEVVSRTSSPATPPKDQYTPALPAEPVRTKLAVNADAVVVPPITRLTPTVVDRSDKSKTPSLKENLRKITLTVRSGKDEEKKVVDTFLAGSESAKENSEHTPSLREELPSVPDVTPLSKPEYKEVQLVPRKPKDSELDLPTFPMQKKDEVIGLADLLLGIEEPEAEIPEQEIVPVPDVPVKSEEHSDEVVVAEVVTPVESIPPASSETLPKADPAVCDELPLAPFVYPTNRTPAVVEGVDWATLQVAYISMEVGVDASIPTYAGGLGILAGDMLRSCADLELPVVGVTLLHRKGYFTQHIDETGWQHEEHAEWKPEDLLVELPCRVAVVAEGRTIAIRAWMYRLAGITGQVNPIIFLDTNLPENVEQDRMITDSLYSGDQRHRLIQELVLGVGGFRILEALGASRLQKFHMNEGHSTLLTVELYKYFAKSENPVAQVRERMVFTTHTPVAAGHDIFPEALVGQVLGDFIPSDISELVFSDGVLNMTKLGLNFSQYINGVAKKHGEVTRELFPGYHIDSITNGVHAGTWTSPSFAKLYDRFLPGWQSDPYSLRYALSIPGEDLWKAHEESKHALIGHINARYHAELSDDVFTIGFARRATSYKRGNMLFSDMERLRHIAARSGKGIQLIFAGKAHPQDEDGKHLIQDIITHMGSLAPQVRAVYLEDYDIALAKLVVAGVDLWLNTPMRPLEASGTSGMKAALNGVPHFSVLDGWWLEGHIENATGWSIGPHPERVDSSVDHEDIEDMYMKLEYVIIPRFYDERDSWIKMMRQTIAINGSFFNSHRMVEQYVLSAYFK